MKKNRSFRFLLVAVLCCFLHVGAFAVPMPPRPIEYTLSDGSKIWIQMTGDEFFSYATTSDGYNVVQSAEDGYFYYAVDAGGCFESSGVRAHDPGRRTPEEQAFLRSVRIPRGAPAWGRAAHQSALAEHARLAEAAEAARPQDVQELRMAAMSAGEKYKALVILVQFEDVKFQRADDRQAYDDLLNQPGYSYNGSTGSAADYYKYNTNGRFDPQFDVIGPYTLPGTLSRWSVDNGHQIAPELLKMVDPDVDFHQYADGKAGRDIYFIYASVPGQGSPIRPHKSFFSPVPVLDGVSITSYACNHEHEMGNPSVRCNIGTFCHEFGHVLGWPDFYDVDGMNPAVLDAYSLMDFGCYNNDSRTPPSLTAMERWLQGWLVPKEMKEVGTYTLKPIAEDDAYIVNTNNPGEFFLLETRSASTAEGRNVWDEKLFEKVGAPSGGPVMMVYQVDRSGQYGMRWDLRTSAYNGVNGDPNHYCNRAIKASSSSLAAWGYPGTAGVTSLGFTSWSGTVLAETITNIAVSGNNITFNLATTSGGGSVSLSDTDLELYKGATKRLTATVTPDDLPNKAVSWSSTNPNVAMVESNGLITTFSAGRTVITAKLSSGTSQASCNVIVHDPAVVIDIIDLQLPVGETEQLSAEVFPESYPNKELTWTSTNEAVATVDPNGLVTGLSDGQATIRATTKVGGIRGECKVSVGSGRPLSVTLNKSDLELKAGTTEKLIATIIPDPNLELIWSSSNTAVARVDETGLVSGIRWGEAVITAKLKNGGAEDSCAVTVTKADEEPTASVTVDAAYQNDAWIKWNYSDSGYNGNFHLEIRRGAEIDATITSSESWAYADKLLPATSYTAALYLDDSGEQGRKVGETTFRTSAADEDFPASIGFTKTEGVTTLHLRDIAEKITSAKWTLNGTIIESPRIAAEDPGRYVVTAEYETANYGETITKVIIIK